MDGLPGPCMGLAIKIHIGISITDRFDQPQRLHHDIIRVTVLWARACKRAIYLAPSNMQETQRQLSTSPEAGVEEIGHPLRAGISLPFRAQ
jgi:hypothetical protein